jgi:small subunit ribosomal protein S6
MDTSARKAEPRTYELTYILSGSLSDQEIEKAKAEIEPLLKRASAKIVKTEEWGKRPLAYIITHDGKKQTEGYYVHLVLSMPADKSQDLDHAMYLNGRVMRHLLLVGEEATVEEQPA